MVDIRQTPEYGNYLQKIGWTVERKQEVNYFIKKIPILKGVLKIQRPEKIDIDLIQKMAQKYGVFQTIVEPKTKKDAAFLASCGFKLSKSPYLPSKTLYLDLTKSKEKLLKELKKDARRVVTKSRGEVKELNTLKEIKTFRNAWKKTVGLNRFVPPVNYLLALKTAFRQFPPLFLASHNDTAEIIGGALFTQSSENISYYWQAFSNREARTSLSQYSLVWHGILWGKRQGCKILDFEGTYDPRFPNESWRGFTHFKKSFGGTEALYPGAFVKYRLPI